MNIVEKAERALLYAEKYGVIEYEIKGDFTIYIVETFEDGKKISYKAEVDLNEMKETRKLM